MKQCYECKKWKDESEFGNKNKCKECRRKYGREYYKKNRDKLLKQRKENKRENKKIVTRKCKNCNRILLFSMFKKCRYNKGGYQDWCKECCNKEEIKQCSKCGKFKKYSEFYKSKTTEDRLTTTCSNCYKDKYISKIKEIFIKRRELFPKGLFVCSICKQIKPIEEFYKNKNNRWKLSYLCKECSRRYYKKEPSQKTKELIELTKKREDLLQNRMFLCTRCRQVKPVEEFQKHKQSKWGVYTICIECHNKSRRKDKSEKGKYSKKYLKKLEQQRLAISRLKKCNKCNQVKNLDEFRFRKSQNRYDSICKKCKKREESKRKVEKNRKKKLKVKKLFEAGLFKCGRCKEIKPISEFYKDKRREYGIESTCKKCRRSDQNNRRSTDQGRLNSSMSAGINKSLKGQKNGCSWESLVEYTYEDLRRHLESLFEDWMTWSNYGDWEVDHIIPVSFFNFSSSDDEEFKICWSLKNLRPLGKKKNNEKRDKITSASKKLLKEIAFGT